MTVTSHVFVLLLLGISFSEAGRLRLDNYVKENAKIKFEQNKRKVFVPKHHGFLLSFDEKAKEAKIRIVYRRFWKDKTLPKFSLASGVKLPDIEGVLWIPPLPFASNTFKTLPGRSYVRGDNWVFVYKKLIFTVPCHRLSNFRYPKDRFRCHIHREVWQPPTHRSVCISNYYSFYNTSVPFTPIKSKHCQELSPRASRIFTYIHRFFKTDWKLLQIREFHDVKSAKAMEFDIERSHPHFFLSEVLAAVAIGVVIIFQSLLPPQMGQRLITGGVGMLMTVSYMVSIQDLEIVREGYEIHLTRLGLGLMVIQALVLAESILCWNLSQTPDSAPQWLLNLPIVGVKTAGDDAQSQWPAATLVIGRITFAINVVVFVILLCVSLPM